MEHYIGIDCQTVSSETFLCIVPFSASNRLRELENQLETLEASKPSAPPALKFKVRCQTL